MTDEEFIQAVEDMTLNDFIECFYDGDAYHLLEDNSFILEELKDRFTNSPDLIADFKEDLEYWLSRKQ